MISKRLLASENELLIVQRFAPPGAPRGRKESLRNANLERDAPFVLWPALQPTAMEQLYYGDCIKDLVVIWCKLKAALHVGKRLSKSAELVEHLGAVHVA